MCVIGGGGGGGGGYSQTEVIYQSINNFINVSMQSSRGSKPSTNRGQIK